MYFCGLDKKVKVAFTDCRKIDISISFQDPTVLLNEQATQGNCYIMVVFAILDFILSLSLISKREILQQEI